MRDPSSINGGQNVVLTMKQSDRSTPSRRSVLAMLRYGQAGHAREGGRGEGGRAQAERNRMAQGMTRPARAAAHGFLAAIPGPSREGSTGQMQDHASGNPPRARHRPQDGLTR